MALRSLRCLWRPAPSAPGIRGRRPRKSRSRRRKGELGVVVGPATNQEGPMSTDDLGRVLWLVRVFATAGAFLLAGCMQQVYSAGPGSTVSEKVVSAEEEEPESPPPLEPRSTTPAAAKPAD